ncbi:glycosyltransferase family 2 protein, partial [Bacteroides fragilis]
QYTFDKSYPLLLCVTMRESFRYAYEVSCLNVSGENMNMFSKFYMRYKNNSSRIAVRQFMSYPVSIGQIFKMPRKRIEIFLYWLISFIPYFFQYVFIVIVRFIRK